MLRSALLLSGLVAAFLLNAPPASAQPPNQDESWRASSAQMAARIQALLDDLRRRMDEIAALPAPGAQPGIGEVEEMIVMQRRLRMLELRQREAQILAEMTAALRRAMAELAEGTGGRHPGPSQPQQNAQDMEFRILSVSGSGDALRAVVWSQRTGRVNVAAGTRLPDGTVVSRVEVDGIWVRRPGETVEIPLGQADGAQMATPSIVNIGPGAGPVPSIPSPFGGPAPPGAAPQAPRPAAGFGLGGAPEPAQGSPPRPPLPPGNPSSPMSQTMPGGR